MSKTPRGIRNNNPGNIDKGQPWKGLAVPSQMTEEQRAEPRFAIFTEPKWGIRAMAKLLMNYQAMHNLRTVDAMIRRYAPPVENKTEAYVRRVSDAMGLQPDERFSMDDFDLAKTMVIEMIKHENRNVQPYDDLTIDTALMLAGIEPPRKVPWPGKSRTTTGTSIAGVGTALTAAYQPIQEAAAQVEPLIPLSENLKWVFIGLTLVGLALATWARWDAAMKGKIG